MPETHFFGAFRMSLLDNLPKNLPFLNKTEEKADYYFALSVGSDKVTGAVWGIEGNRLRIINTATVSYNNPDDLESESSQASLIEASNVALDEALMDFQPEPTQVLFGVPDNWLNGDDLKSEYLKVLRKLVKELDIQPLAYVSSMHAIIHSLQQSQGVPVTAVMVEVGEQLVISVVKAGKVLETVKGKKSKDLASDIEKALLAVKEVEVLPSKIIVFGEDDLEREKSDLAGYSWMNQLPFLHLPKVDILAKDTTIKAVCLAGGSEMNPDLVLSADTISAGIPAATSRRSRLRQMREEEPTAVSDVGFVAGDIREMDDEILDEEYAGGGDVVPTNTRGYEPQSKIQSLLAPIMSLPAVFMGLIKRDGGAAAGPSSSKSILKNRNVIIPVVLLLLVLGAFVFLPKATVEVFIDLQVLEKDAVVVADPAIASVDEPNKRIPGKTVETTVEGSAKGQATGKKQVGDSAKGTVIIYNKTTGAQSFPAGTKLTASNGLAFTLDTSVNVASQSAVDGGISFGKTTVNATATGIGPEGNIAAGQELSISGQSASNFSAKVDKAFSGGVSKDVTVVTADDQKRLLAQLSSELRTKARDNIQGKLEGDMKILTEALEEKVTKQSYSKAVNDQASEFTLTMTANYKGTAYNDNDLKMIVSKLVETNVPQGFELDLTHTETQADVAKIEKDGKLSFAAKFKAKLMPKLDKEKMKRDIAGKSVDGAQEKLREVQNVIGANIQIKPSLPGPLKRLPILPGNITLDVMAK